MIGRNDDRHIQFASRFFTSYLLEIIPVVSKLMNNDRKLIIQHLNGIQSETIKPEVELLQKLTKWCLNTRILKLQAQLETAI